MFKKEHTARTTIGDQDIKKYKPKNPIMNLRNKGHCFDENNQTINKSKLDLGVKLIQNL